MNTLNILKTVSKQFQTSFKVNKMAEKDAYGAIGRREHCWRFGAKKRSSGSFRSSTEKESDEESQESSEFPYITLLNRVIR